MARRERSPNKYRRSQNNIQDGCKIGLSRGPSQTWIEKRKKLKQRQKKTETNTNANHLRGVKYMTLALIRFQVNA